MRKASDADQFRVCILVCWTLWFFRDKHWFEGQELDAMTVAKFARSYGDMLNHPSMTVLNFHGSTNEVVRWKSPSRYC